jgi:hypothetical protein
VAISKDGSWVAFTAERGRPIEQVMDSNGVAREFWNEVFDLRTPVDDLRGKRETKTRRKKVRAVLTRRPTRASS